ncbi:hypothetical protein KsCSTR_08330 [Candidatus Kuenenia stuttgartiensis]|jgi:hypothetical protein|uniref:Uncharacterized protein n=1 Tax=Kuenenia stuttgartiensis TaxID=174633 RepID=Q1PZ97_KUEST|nr:MULTISPECIES: hypothetical protein [Kuenenia]MBE7546786.1 hypothetical protein [Planctomycetia bacterium]MBW7942060.1 hypothetical protein [Candidatus Kuenenia stuttgartiensis]MBZ0190184.1 hypothetical protein [Candidatus Kuenenia stuttgartiensis]MCL4725816.1 hypothetical protein [Candidatus Kuenenia stuttgartiensis]MCZ7623841.1 hypothetical protein [Candidatus Kuenenia sp.]
MICVDNRGDESSLEKRKLYEVLTDRIAETHCHIRVVDELGEDYLYPEKFFAPVRLPPYHKRKISIRDSITFHLTPSLCIKSLLHLHLATFPLFRLIYFFLWV